MSQYYLNQTIPLLLNTSGGPNICPILTVITPTTVKTFDLTTGVTNLSSGNTVISNSYYELNYIADELGAHKYFWRTVDCTNPSTDTTNTVVCGECVYGTFNIIKNPLDETVSDHLINGTLGYKLEKLISQTLTIERRGTGECMRQIKVKGARTTVGFVYNDSGQVVAQASGEPIDQYDSILTFYLNTGSYRVRIIDPSNCDRKPVELVMNVDCGGTTVNECQSTTF